MLARFGLALLPVVAFAACVSLDGLSSGADAGDGGEDTSDGGGDDACSCGPSTTCGADACIIPARSDCTNAFPLPGVGRYSVTICPDAATGRFSCWDAEVPAAYVTAPLGTLSFSHLQSFSSVGLSELGRTCGAPAPSTCLRGSNLSGRIARGNLIAVGSLEKSRCTEVLIEIGPYDAGPSDTGATDAESSDAGPG